MGACSLEGRGAFSNIRAFLSGRSGDGGCSRGVGTGVATLFDCHNLLGGNDVAAAMLCVWRSQESVENEVLMSSFRHLISRREGGRFPVSSHLRSAL